MMKKLTYLFVLTSILIASQSCINKNEMKNKSIDKVNMDLTANPGEDFDQYANGGWMKNNPIPEDKSRHGSFGMLADENELQVKALIKKITSVEHTEGTVEQKVADFVNSGLDTVSIEKQGLSPLNDEFNRIAQLNSKASIEEQILHFHKMGITSAFAVFGSADAKNSEMVITHLYQSGLAMPDKDYYLTDNERFKDIRAKYIAHLERMFILLGDDKLVAEENAQTIMSFETRLAISSRDRQALRDPHANYNKMMLESLVELAPSYNWEAYFTGIGLGNPGEINVSQPEFIEEFAKMINEVSVDDWKTYFRWNLINTTANYLSDEFVDADFDFYGKIMRGTPENRPRWKRVLSGANGYLGEAIGQAYVKEYFPPEAKERMLELVGNLKISLGERIENLDWMSNETKKNGLEKLATMNVKIGYPDKWKDYTEMTIKKDSYILNILRAKEFGFNEMINKINKPVDKSEWFMAPQVVNAYYSSNRNEIVFPAGILQPPFFYIDADDAVNYGAIGVVIGHEMTHGFDDKGRYYDKNGNLNTWWTNEDSERFTEKANVLVQQFNNFTVLDTVKANGKYTLGENIADLGGINIAFAAFMKTEQWKNQEDKIEDFTPNQRFFLSYAHLWAQNIRDKEILRLTQEDVHSLGHLRIIGPLRNVAEFHEAFNIQNEDYMFLPEQERASIW